MRIVGHGRGEDHFEVRQTPRDRRRQAPVQRPVGEQGCGVCGGDLHIPPLAVHPQRVPGVASVVLHGDRDGQVQAKGYSDRLSPQVWQDSCWAFAPAPAQRSHDFPAPLDTLTVGRIWAAADVRKYAASRRQHLDSGQDE